MSADTPVDKYQIYWDQICEVYFLTKHYLLLGEEISDDFDTFLQPLKEHRDTFDHLARAYGYKTLKSDSLLDKKELDEYRLSNMKKALGHTYRAFFDAADWLSYKCRKKIRLALERTGKTREEILAVYPAYDKAKDKLENAYKTIARIRENKDESSNEDQLVGEVREYKVLLDDLLHIYDEIQKLF